MSPKAKKRAVAEFRRIRDILGKPVELEKKGKSFKLVFLEEYSSKMKKLP